MLVHFVFFLVAALFLAFVCFAGAEGPAVAAGGWTAAAAGVATLPTPGDTVFFLPLVFMMSESS